MIITNCPRCGAMNVTTTCNKCGWSQFTKSTVSTGVYNTIGEIEIMLSGKALLDNYKRLLLENRNLKERIAELESAQRWIPVSERLPEVGEEVFVCDESGHRRVDWLVCKPIDGVGETLFYSEAYDDDPPTHWMPLPELPEVQE